MAKARLKGGSSTSAGRAAKRVASAALSTMRPSRHCQSSRGPTPARHRSAPSQSLEPQRSASTFTFPFCSAICNYCNFNRGLFDADLKARYVDALVAEIRARAGAAARRARPTPSSSAAERRRCSSPPRSRASSPPAATPSTLAADAEITLEANPETVIGRHAWRPSATAGVNRLSFGVQSFRDDELQRLVATARRRPGARRRWPRRAPRDSTTSASI